MTPMRPAVFLTGLFLTLVLAQALPQGSSTNEFLPAGFVFATGESSRKTPQVELFVTNWCPYCKQAIRFFQARGIAPAIHDIEKDSAAAQRKKQLDPAPGVPFALVNGHKIHGYSEEAYQRALDTR